MISQEGKEKIISWGVKGSINESVSSGTRASKCRLLVQGANACARNGNKPGEERCWKKWGGRSFITRKDDSSNSSEERSKRKALPGMEGL